MENNLQTITTREETIELIEELYDASMKYYQQLEESPLTDEEFDSKMEYLKTLYENNNYPELFTENSVGYKLLENDTSLGTTIQENVETIEHIIPMMSLGKAKNEKELELYVNRMLKAGETTFKIQAKLDGFALSARYMEGKLSQLVTRGTGAVGENVSYLLKEENLHIVGLPEIIADERNIEVRGEIFLTVEQFSKVSENREKVDGDAFKNPRNAVVGIMKRAKLGLPYEAELTFGAYTYIVGETLHDLEELDSEGFNTIHSLTREHTGELNIDDLDTEQLYSSIQVFGELRKDLPYPTDGVVVKPTREAEFHLLLGSTSHHPISQIAYKYPSVESVSTVVSITTTVGMTGKLTPVAEIIPTEVDGSVIRFVTCNNYNWLYEKDIRVGSIVTIAKANDVIPCIVAVVSNTDEAVVLDVPDDCPECGMKLTADDENIPPKTLYCSNLDCPARAFGIFCSALRKNVLNIDGLGESVARVLFDSGMVKDISDLYSLDLEKLAAVQLVNEDTGRITTLGRNRAENIITHIEKSRSLPLFKYIVALGIPRVGSSVAKTLVKQFGSMDRILSITVDDLVAVEGFQRRSAEMIIQGFRDKNELLEKLYAVGLLKHDDEDNHDHTGVVPTVSKVSGKSFCISGSVPAGFSNRSEFVDWLEENDAVFHSSPKKDTDYMIGDPDGSSSKLAKARRNGTVVITVEQFGELFLV